MRMRSCDSSNFAERLWCPYLLLERERERETCYIENMFLFKIEMCMESEKERALTSGHSGSQIKCLRYKSITVFTFTVCMP